jgi:radical SAM superfamily enzyme YgiQ (UPF0313 family)
VRVALVSTYELGHQPLHVASPAGTLRRAGHEVRGIDLSVDSLDLDTVEWAEVVAFSVPMHTAMRLARGACEEVRARRPDVPVCFYGLYAGLDGAMDARPMADVAIAGEYEPALVEWIGALGRSAPVPPSPAGHTRVALGRGRFGLPARDLLPGLERYARLTHSGRRDLVGYVEASHGCAHRCCHCPVPVVYDGRTRLVDADAVLADAAQLVAMGARHITFGDPDFLNGPHHARRVVDAVHGAFPELSFDVTAKVEHVLRHRDLWPRWAAAGCLFVVSAFESASDAILDRLRKGHSGADEVEAVAVLRGAGIEPRPSLLPFTPWTNATDVLDLLDLVQFTIRLLVPPGSLLLTSGALAGCLGPYDHEHLGWTWSSPDTRLDRLQQDLTVTAARAGDEGWSALHAYDEVRAQVIDALGGDAAHRAAPPRPDAGLRSVLEPDDRPRLTESWFCCAEPTDAQRLTAGAGAQPRGAG